MEESTGQFDELPAGLREELRRLSGGDAPVGIPARVDEAILAMAGQRLRAVRWAHRPSRLVLRWVGGATAAAAAILAVVLFMRQGHDGKTGAPKGQPVADVRDLNRDGQVNMIDAYLLARQVKEGKAPGSGLDVNGDGVVDAKDADAMALASVKLGGPVR